MTILAATDLSDNSRPALRYAAQLATSLGEPLRVVNVVELWERDTSRILETFEDNDVEPSEHARTALSEFVADTVGDEVEVELHVVVGHPPTERILAVADEIGAMMVVAGTSGHSKIAEAFFGSTISALARQSHHPVLAVPPQADVTPIKTILAPVDLSKCSEKSLRFAGDLAKRLEAHLFVQHSAPFGTPAVAPPLAYVPESATQIRKAAHSRVESMVEDAGLQGSVRVLVELGSPHTGILRSVEEQSVDLIVMGTHGRTGVSKFFLGSTAERILRDRPCPVLVIRDFD